MDIKDVSREDPYPTLMKSALASAKRASKRKGEIIHDHPPVHRLVSDFLTNLEKPGPGSTKDVVAISLVQVPYPPCVLTRNDLRPIMISDMRLETHHRGTGMLLHILTSPQRDGADVTAIVEDGKGTALLLQLYHQPSESVVPARGILQPGGGCIVKEPFLKCETNGAYYLRVDHVTDVVWLDNSDEHVPEEWRTPVGFPNNDSNIMWARGNEAVKKQGWVEAERLVATTPDEAKPAYLNRSIANLRLGRPEKALSDATQCADTAKLFERSLVREASALYKLGNFSKCIERLDGLLLSNPTNSDASAELGRARARLHEQNTGEYNFNEMYKQAGKTPPLIDCATFHGPCEMRDSPGKGQGLFITRKVAAGELLICEKAFAYSFVEEDSAEGLNVLMNLSTKKTVVGGQALLVTQIVQQLAHNPKASSEFLKLHCGDYSKAPASDAGGLPVVDSFLVEKIVSLNAFGAPRTSQGSSLIPPCGSNPQDPRNGGGSNHTTSGIWVLASRINHSCLSNCSRSSIGDMQIVRAMMDLDAGTDLFTYRRPGFMESHADVQRDLMKWGFQCRCDL
ncbi:related to TPR domain protein [Cephalotrichum gorgonifer]|uniref:Related to TPR domain protein n=1 Tax=Cephalotrichum gorgonifer TaxID=2041049 RepID=A0AAE8MYC2_9PEZI|nr:related to TPR domain protein [Cephalotrichum gorgonifer]